MNRKKKENAAQSTRQLMGIDGIKDYCIATRMGDLVFFIIKPTNISVLSDSSISARIYALLNVVKGQAEIEMLALNSKESAAATRINRFFRLGRANDLTSRRQLPHLPVPEPGDPGSPAKGSGTVREGGAHPAVGNRP